MNECECVDGEWGSECPACHQILPNPGPIRSWKSQREPEVSFGRVSDRRWTLAERESRMAAVRSRQKRRRSEPIPGERVGGAA